MTLSFSAFCSQLTASPLLDAAILLTLAVVFVNGWTDAPNAIAAAVATSALSFRQAALMAGICNLLGGVCTAWLNAQVAYTIYSIADFSGQPDLALAALCAALTAIVGWAVAAWLFGLPTSESHALTAGLTGAAVALRGSFSAVHWWAWGRLLLGLILSVAAGFWLARLIWGVLPHGPRASRLFLRLQIPAAAGMSFCHGAQDGQKFMGVFLLCVTLAQGSEADGSFSVPLWLAVLCSLVMALGTCVGGGRIVRTIGTQLAPIDPCRGFAADLSGILCLLGATLLGLPVSTTHTKSAAIWGAGSLGPGHQVNRPVLAQLWLSWLLTFPCCGLIGYGAALLFLRRPL